jgi:hypothetical protein
LLLMLFKLVLFSNRHNIVLIVGHNNNNYDVVILKNKVKN